MLENYEGLGTSYLDLIHSEIDELEFQLCEKSEEIRNLKEHGMKGTELYNEVMDEIQIIEYNINRLYDEIDEIIYNYFN